MRRQLSERRKLTLKCQNLAKLRNIWEPFLVGLSRETKMKHLLCAILLLFVGVILKLKHQLTFQYVVSTNQNRQVCPIYKAYDPYLTPNTTRSNPQGKNKNVCSVLTKKKGVAPAWIRFFANKFGDKFIYNNAQLLQNYADDYGHSVHLIPQAAFRPSSVNDVSSFVKVNKLVFFLQ